MKRALVLGAGGFIGSHMVKRLKKEGYWVRGVDLKYPDFSDTAANEFITGDLTDRDFMRRVIHFRGETGNFYASVPFQYEIALAPEVVGMQAVQIVEPRDGVLALVDKAHARAHVFVKGGALGVVKGQVEGLELALGRLLDVAKEERREAGRHRVFSLKGVARARYRCR